MDADRHLPNKTDKSLPTSSAPDLLGEPGSFGVHEGYEEGHEDLDSRGRHEDFEGSECAVFLDAILDGEPFPDDTAEHLTVCPSCQAIEQTSRHLVSYSAEHFTAGDSTDVSPALRARVASVGRAWVQRRRDMSVYERQQAERSSGARQTAVSSWWSLAFLRADWWRWSVDSRQILRGSVMTLAGLLLCVLIPLWFFSRSGPGSEPITSQVAHESASLERGESLPPRPDATTQGQVCTPGAVNEAVQVAAGERQEIVLPGGRARFSVSGPARFLPMPNGFHLWQGELCVDVQPSFPAQEPFQGTTPHAVITVLGTVFSVRVTAEQTKVAVSRGKVHVAESDGTAHTLTRGEEIDVHSMGSPPLANGATGATGATSSIALDPDSEDQH